ncbi:membrane protein [Mycobacterium phage Aminay]|uniref:Membrane protein n=1 Tax=Mycobacterium phage Aminay TaxID=2250291 RepID=A0A345KV29_9CAUD|nr:membrane protein [Mycobacterium phage Aminay]AXH46881.1 membrane protein [Mycobacterium phage Aminay]
MNAIRTTVIALALAAGVALPAAGTAHADADSFIDELQVPADYRAAALSVGYSMCSEMKDGTPLETISARVTAQTDASRSKADRVVWAAARNLCPEVAE